MDVADAAMCRAVSRKAESLLCWVGVLVNNAGSWYWYSLLGNVEDLGKVTYKRISYSNDCRCAAHGHMLWPSFLCSESLDTGETKRPKIK